MANLLDDIHVKDIKHLDSTPPEGVTVPKSVMTLEAEVVVDPQPLKKLRGYAQMSRDVSTLLPAEAQITLHALFSCFDKQKNVQEGLIGDLLFGFEVGGVPRNCSFMGLQQLQRAGYIKFQAKDNTYVDIMSDLIGSAWVRYQPKLLEMVYEP